MYTIVEICRKTKLSSRTLRVWEEAGLIKSSRDENGMRLYQDDIVDTIDKIQLLKEFGLSLCDIASILKGNNIASIEELLQTRRVEIEKQLQHFIEIQKKLLQVEKIANITRQRGQNLLLPTKEMAEKLCQSLISQSEFAHSRAHTDYLKNEIEGMNYEDIIGWIGAVKNIKQYADEHGIPTRFMRGGAASSLILRLLSWWTHIDPVEENLVPQNPFLADLHFDVPFSGTEHFLDFISKTNSSSATGKFVAFRLPILDIMHNFSEMTETNPFHFESESKLMAKIKEGNIDFVFGLDDKGATLANKIYPEFPEHDESLEIFVHDLQRYSPKSKEDVLRFIALRRPSTLKYLELAIAGYNVSYPNCSLASALPTTNHGIVIFREEMLHAVRQITGWSYHRINLFRQSIYREKMKPEEAEAFIQATDASSLDLFKNLTKLVFHKAHLVGWWQLIAMTLSCKIRNEKAWKTCIETWENENGLKWNDFGIVWKEAKLLTGP